MIDTSFSQAYWEDFYGESERLGSGRADPVLFDVVGALERGPRWTSVAARAATPSG